LIVRWLKKVGEAVKAKDPLCEVETDKALFEIEAPADGYLLATFFPEGADVPVLETIAALGYEGEHVADLRPRTTPVDPVAGPVQKPTVAPTQPQRAPQTTERAHSPPVSPRAARLLRKHKLNGTRLTGSGPNGRVVERDVLSFLSAAVPPRDTPHQEALPHALPQGDCDPIPLAGVRRLVAERMVHSLQTTAQLTLHASVVTRPMLTYRERLKAAGFENISINDVVLFVVARTLPQFPPLNALLTDETLVQYRDVHLGLAVDTPRGLLVPVIVDAHKKSLTRVSAEAKALKHACVEGRIHPQNLEGGTFTVTNLGGLDVEAFTPILNPPQVGILGVGNRFLKPIDLGGRVEFEPRLGVSLTFDHRALDGAAAARFLQTLQRAFQHFQEFLATV